MAALAHVIPLIHARAANAIMRDMFIIRLHYHFVCFVCLRAGVLDTYWLCHSLLRFELLASGRLPWIRFLYGAYNQSEGHTGATRVPFSAACLLPTECAIVIDSYVGWL